MNTLMLTRPAGATRQHTMDGKPEAYQVDRSLPPTSEAALAFIRGETAAGLYLARIATDTAQPGELAQRIGVSSDPGLAGFLARIEKALRAHLREVRT